jgi:hypothetical protein
MRSTADAKAKLMLLSIATLPFNGFVFHMCHQRPVMQDHLDGAMP